MRRFNLFGNFGSGRKDDAKQNKELAPLDAFCGGLDLDNILGSFFGEPFGFGLLDIRNKPSLDVYEKDNKVVVKADLPGVDKKEIKLHLEDNILTLSANRKVEREVEKDGYYHTERTYGTFQRSIRLPEGLKKNQVKAAYKDGVLIVEIPKSEEKAQKGRQIDIE